MRFSLAAVAAALPALAVAQEAGQFDQYVAKFQNIIGDFGSKLNVDKHDPVAALEAKLGSMKLNVLSLSNFREVLWEPVPADATKPTEWWVLGTGGNNSCHGRCGRLEAAFNETAAKFAVTPGSPHMAMINCDDQPILCTSISLGPSLLWSVEMLPPPAEIDIYKKRMNVSTVTSDDFVALQTASREEVWTKVDSWFHPFNGKAHENYLALPFAYVLWFFNLVPSWAFMLIVSFASRSMMTRRMQDQH